MGFIHSDPTALLAVNYSMKTSILTSFGAL
jgi:hypothetical protein